MRFAWHASSAVSGGLFSALTSVLAVLLLAPAQYGLFSIVYLIFAFGISLQYSIINEAWARTRESSGTESDWASYSGALIALSGIVALVATGPSTAIPELRSAAVFLVLAVFFALYRNGVRYHSVATGALTRVVISDCAGILAFLVPLVVGWHLPDIQKVALSWFASVLLSSVVLKSPVLLRSRSLASWARTHGAAIRPLLFDSLVMDLGAIGTPFLLAGLLGAGPFGTYRAVSNAALPVRLLIDPLRPTLGRIGTRVLLGRAGIALISSATVVLTIGSYGALAILVPHLGFRLGTLTSLVAFAVPSSVFVAGSFLGTIFYIVCRTKATPRGIFVGRALQTLFVVVAPIAGFLVTGLPGAIWGFAISSVISAIAWISLTLLLGRHAPNMGIPMSQGDL